MIRSDIFINSFEKDLAAWVIDMNSSNSSGVWAKNVKVIKDDAIVDVKITCFANRELIATACQIEGLGKGENHEMLAFIEGMGQKIRSIPAPTFTCTLEITGSEEFTVQIRKIIEEKGIACIV